MVNTLLQLFKGFSFSVDEFNTIISKMEIKAYKKSDTLLKIGAACENIYLVRSGLIRGYVISEGGGEKTLWVNTAGSFTTDYTAFINQQPTTIAIQILQDAEIVSLSYNNMQYLHKNIPEFNSFSRVVTEQFLIKLISEIKMLQVSVSPLQRYNTFLQLHADIIDQIPQHMIADMINVSPVHLSRIKSNSAKNCNNRNQ